MKTPARIAFLLLFITCAFTLYGDMDFNDFVKEYTLVERLTGELDYIYTNNYNWEYHDNRNHFTVELGAQYAY